MPTAKTKTMTRAKTKKKSVAPVVQNAPKARRLKLPGYKPFRWQRIKYPARLPSAWRLTLRTISLLWRNRKLFLGILIIYALLSIIFVHGLSSGVDVDSIKQRFGLQGIGQLAVGLSVLTTIVSSSGDPSNQTAGIYQIVLVILVSLATIWAARQSMAGQKVRIRDAFYKGMYPLVPFILILVVVLLQTIPFLLGGTLYAQVLATGIAATALEQILWTVAFVVLAFVSIYMLCSSLFALVIVTLPDMTPMKALRSARQLVRYRRLQVFRKLIFVPVIVIGLYAVTILPVILYATGLTVWVMFVLSTFVLVAINTYVYVLYKELLA